MRYFCSNDNTELWDIYDPDIDEDGLSQMPDDLSQEERDLFLSRRETLLEILKNQSIEKQKYYNEIMTKQSAVILVCPYCKSVYDSQGITMREKTHSDSNLIPFRKPQRHKVISDDKESYEREVSDPFDQISSSDQVFLAKKQDQDEQKERKNNTLFYERAISIDKIVHASKELNSLVNKFGKENVDIDIQIPE